MIELIAVARILSGRIRAFYRTRIIVVSQNHKFVDLVGAAIIAHRIGRIATKEGTNLMHEFLADLIKLLTVKVVVVSSDW